MSLFFFVCPEMTLLDWWGVKVQDLSGKLTNFSPVSRHLLWLFYPIEFYEVLTEQFVFVLVVVLFCCCCYWCCSFVCFFCLGLNIIYLSFILPCPSFKAVTFPKNQPYSPSMRRLCFVSLSTYFSSTLFDHGQNSTQPHFTRSISQLRLSHQVQTGSTLFPKINTQSS